MADTKLDTFDEFMHDLNDLGPTGSYSRSMGRSAASLLRKLESERDDAQERLKTHVALMASLDDGRIIEWGVDGPYQPGIQPQSSEANARAMFQVAKDYEALGKRKRGRARLVKRAVTRWVEVD